MRDFLRLVPEDWPPHAVTLRLLNPYEHNILTVSKGEKRAYPANHFHQSFL